MPIICASGASSAERSPRQPWATDMITLMITLLCQANAVVGEDQDQDLETDTIFSKAAASNPPRPRRPGTRGRVKQAPAYNLILPSPAPTSQIVSTRSS